MDFYKIETRPGKGKNKFEIYPEYKVCRSKDLIIRGGTFYAVYDNDSGFWTEDKVLIAKVIDEDIEKKYNQLTAYEERKNVDPEEKKKYVPKYLVDFSNNHWSKFDQYLKTLPDSKKYILDQNVTFFGAHPSKEDFVSKTLPYALPDTADPESYSAWDKMLNILYDPEEREKIEWAIGSILSGDGKKIQKFLVFYGPQGSGKSTILNIVMKLFSGYYATFKAESLVSSGDQFGCKFLSSNPLVAIDEDTNLSRIETNATINKIASHEELEVNEKYKSQYVIKPMCMMMLGTNKPVRITDAKSGIIRRLIDIEPSGRKIKPIRTYEALVRQVEQQLGAIARHCMDVYQDPSRGMHYYDDYIPERMMYRTDPFFNFMQEHFDEYSHAPYVQATLLWDQWKNYCNESEIGFTKKRYEIIDEAKNYFNEFYKESTTIDGVQVRSRFVGLKTEKFILDKEKPKKPQEEKMPEIGPESEKAVMKEKPAEDIPADDIPEWLQLKPMKSLLDDLLKDCKAQYDTGNPAYPLKSSWDKCRTKLKDLDTSRTHFVQGFPETLITVDFDRKGADGKKNLKANLEAASGWTPTYAELSNSGAALHLAYWFDGDPNELSSVFDDEIEIKVFPNDKSLPLRRRLSKCNDLPIAHISSGLPFKEKKNMVNWEGLKDDKHLRNMVMKIIRKEVNPYGAEPKTITCMKFMRDVLEQAKADGMSYDIRDLDHVIEAFAMNSHHNARECLDIYYGLNLIWPKPEDRKDPTLSILDSRKEESKPIVILDCEVVKNLTLVVYKELEPDGVPAIRKKPSLRQKKCVRLFNPSPEKLADLLENVRMVGHNVVGYDDYILYARMLGKSTEEICELSHSIIKSDRKKIPYGYYNAKNLSYTDTLDASSKKKGLKKIEIEMHIPHKEMEIDWEKPLPEEKWELLAQYCENDVLATEAYFLSKDFQADFKARQILANLTGMTVNDSTNNLTAKLIFGDVAEPWHEFVYPDLKKKFPLYRFIEKPRKESYYGDELIGEGGRVYAEEGTYYNVVTFDVASMHPTSIIVENGFGPYTKHYEDLLKARIAIKHKDYEAARKMFGGKLAPYLENDEDADALSYALKIALNSVYGMTSASFQNRFKDPRNIDNWVAKRGALFMEKLRHEVQSRGGKVIHIKTDSIKLVNPTQELSDFVIAFGKEYGYNFEVESRYERICLVNHAVYIALRAKDDPGWMKECAKAKKRAEETETPYIEPTRWTATGAQFAHPYVFKRLFSHEPMDFWDFCETKNVKTSLYLDLNERLPDVSAQEKEKSKIEKRIKMLEKKMLEPDISEDDLAKIDAELEDLPKDIEALDEMIAKGHCYVFVGGTGEFMPILPGSGGGLLLRKEDDGGFGYATGAKGYRWLESERMQDLKDWKKYIDIRYFRGLVDDARDTIGVYGDPDLFIYGEDNIILPEERVEDINDDPWRLPCRTEQYAYCSDCPDFAEDENGNPICSKGHNITNQILGESKEILL